MTRPPGDRVIVDRAIELLYEGVLPSVLPSRLMEEYGLSPSRAQYLAGWAVRSYKEQTKDKRKPGEQ